MKNSALVLILLLMTSCTSVRYVPIEKVRYEQKTDSIVITDTITEKENIVIREVDSVYMASLGIQINNMKAWLVDKRNERNEKGVKEIVRDIIVRDSIPYIVEKEVKVTEETPLWKKARNFLLLFCLCLLTYKIGRGRS